MTSKIKKLIKAHGRYMKAQEDLKRHVFLTQTSVLLGSPHNCTSASSHMTILVVCRSQGRFERLADALASDSLKSGTKEQSSSVNAGNDDPYNAMEMSPCDQRQKHGFTAGKRSTALSTSEEEKTGNT